jgi:hypothetical protein
MPAKGPSAQNVSHAESIRTFRPSRLKDSHRPLPALLDFIRMPNRMLKKSAGIRRPLFGLFGLFG